MQAIVDWLLSVFNTVFQFLLDLLLYIPHQIYSLFIDGLLAILNSSVFSLAFANDITTNFSTLMTTSAGIAWWLGVFEFGYGIGVIVSAYVARFVLRRIPLIG